MSPGAFILASMAITELFARGRCSKIFPEALSVQETLMDKNSFLAGKYSDIVDSGAPSVVRNIGETIDWPAFREWDESFFVKHLPLMKVHRSKQPTTRLHSSVNPLFRTPGVQWLRPYTEENVTATDFLWGPKVMAIYLHTEATFPTSSPFHCQLVLAWVKIGRC